MGHVGACYTLSEVPYKHVQLAVPGYCVINSRVIYSSSRRSMAAEVRRHEGKTLDELKGCVQAGGRAALRN
ncbi:unnamed protein product [Phytophthora fragariaefolia]|uniref:Unnamed protein product n=1 Tax=Phytophthora fragariaefolia TaxID=1490495 RepID=A0A9W6YM12_9STRA|nr:unnamed protein product [Phytophthora fragariaefolia]